MQRRDGISSAGSIRKRSGIRTAGWTDVPSNGILSAVDDLAAAVSAVKARGIPVLMENETRVCSMATINDIEGNLVTLHKREPT